jgi:hypothetical protein
MNNFVFSQDPLLYSTTIPQHQPTDMDIKRQLDTVMAQYQAMQQKPPVQQEYTEDYIGDLDNLIKNLDQTTSQMISSNEEFMMLNNDIQIAIQTEIMNNVKSKLNSNPEIISKVKRLKNIIKDVKEQQDNENRKSMNELNDYIKNYSDMTFNEYKQLKNSK